MSKRILVFIFAFIAVQSFGQSKKIWLETADKYYKKYDYFTALEYYKRALDDTTIMSTSVLPYEVDMVNLKIKKLQDTSKAVIKDTTFKPSTYDYILYRIANCYHKVADYKKAEVWFRRCADRGAYSDSRFHYAQALMNNKKYNEAITEYETFMLTKPSDSLSRVSQHDMAGCFYALDSNNVHVGIRVKMMDTATINKGTSNFAPIYWGGDSKIIFTSARSGGVVLDPEKQQSEFLCDLYWVERKDTAWTKPHNFGRPVNTTFHDGAGVMDADEILYFTRWNDNNRKEASIFLARMFQGKFFEALKLDNLVNLPNYRTIQPYVTFDGSTMYYSSNRPGGKGGYDIWMCKLDEEGMPSSSVNLGEPINTPGDEMTPYFHVISQTLFFSSNGHPGIGGLDLFKSSFNIDDSVYSMPINLGPPINSSKDDAYIVYDRLLQKGMFASDRQDCPDGHCFDIYEFDNESIYFDLKGFVYDANTGEPIPSALVTVKDVHGEDEPLLLITDDKGFYSTPLKENMEYFLKAQKKSYFADAGNVATKGLTETTHLEKDFNLNKIPEGDIVIEGIEYDLNKTTLRPESKLVLDKIYDVMHVNDNILIEINAHTDTRGSDKYNLKLSEGRAKSCVDYLVSKGISIKRMISKGYGETKPLVTDEEIAALPTEEEKEAAHQKNRRTAFRVTGEGELKVSSPNQ